MLSKSEIKNISRLKQKKYRKTTGLFVVEGVKLVREVLNSKLKVTRLFVTEENHNDFSRFEGFEVVKSVQMQQLSSMKTPPGVIALVEIPPDAKFTFTGGVLLAESINDPGNLGTMLRTADWFGIKTIILSEDSVDVYNPKTVQASMGSIFRVAVKYNDLDLAVKELNANKVRVYGATLNGKNVYQTQFPENFALLMGSESHGLSPELLELCSETITVPAFGQAESLNVAVSCAVILGEIKRGLTFKMK